MIAKLALTHKLPSVGDGPYFVEAGGLLLSQKIIWLWQDALHGMWIKL
jgi:hypothetical protein